MTLLLRYFSALPSGKLALWCYLIWYLGMLALYFNPSAEIWFNSLGISLVVGYALFLSTGPGTLERFRRDVWGGCEIVCVSVSGVEFFFTGKRQGLYFIVVAPFAREPLGGKCLFGFCSVCKAFAFVRT